MKIIKEDKKFLMEFLYLFLIIELILLGLVICKIVYY
jgi:hypothetical protein